jgi:threonine dehydratase
MLTMDAVRDAARVLYGRVSRTPLVLSPTLSELFGAEIYLKLENLQRTGSFKIRGAMYRIQHGLAGIGPAGVVAASAGNHAQGVALAARQAGLKAVIVMPEWVSISKQEATRAYGGEVVAGGGSIGECLARAEELARSGRTLIHPFDDPLVIAGQGTVGLEIFEDLPDAGQVLVPVGGGGLIAGIGIAARALQPACRVIGVQAAGCPSMAASLAAGRITEVPAVSSIADGITVRRPGRHTFEIARTVVDRVVTVAEPEVAAAVLMLLERKKVLAEGAGAVPLAALLSGAVAVAPGSRTVLVVSGGNLDTPLLERIIAKGLTQGGRVLRLKIVLADVPGALAGLLQKVADARANVLHIRHDRGLSDLPVNLTRVTLELETRGAAHGRRVRQDLAAAGYRVVDG